MPVNSIVVPCMWITSCLHLTIIIVPHHLCFRFIRVMPKRDMASYPKWSGTHISYCKYHNVRWWGVKVPNQPFVLPSPANEGKWYIQWKYWNATSFTNTFTNHGEITKTSWTNKVIENESGDTYGQLRTGDGCGSLKWEVDWVEFNILWARYRLYETPM